MRVNTVSSRAAQTARDLTTKQAAIAKGETFNHSTAWAIRGLPEIDLRLRGPSSSARLGMTELAGILCARRDERLYIPRVPARASRVQGRWLMHIIMCFWPR